MSVATLTESLGKDGVYITTTESILNSVSTIPVLSNVFDHVHMLGSGLLPGSVILLSHPFPYYLSSSSFHPQTASDSKFLLFHYADKPTGLSLAHDFFKNLAKLLPYKAFAEIATLFF